METTVRASGFARQRAQRNRLGLCIIKGRHSRRDRRYLDHGRILRNLNAQRDIVPVSHYLGPCGGVAQRRRTLVVQDFKSCRVRLVPNLDTDGIYAVCQIRGQRNRTRVRLITVCVGFTGRVERDPRSRRLAIRIHNRHGGHGVGFTGCRHHDRGTTLYNRQVNRDHEIGYNRIDLNANRGGNRVGFIASRVHRANGDHVIAGFDIRANRGGAAVGVRHGGIIHSAIGSHTGSAVGGHAVAISITAVCSHASTAVGSHIVRSHHGFGQRHHAAADNGSICRDGQTGLVGINGDGNLRAVCRHCRVGVRHAQRRSGVIDRDGDVYRFAHVVFPDIVCGNGNRLGTVHGT